MKIHSGGCISLKAGAGTDAVPVPTCRAGAGAVPVPTCRAGAGADA